MIQGRALLVTPPLFGQVSLIEHFIHRQVGALHPAQRVGSILELVVGAERRADPWDPYAGSPEVPVDGWVEALS